MSCCARRARLTTPVAPHSTFNWLRLSLGVLGFLLLAAPYLLFFLLAQIPAAYAALVSGA
jgi:apolipoprotein N-acyltransferase